ncbi:MAG: RNA polymerase factor sigma-54, partial [Gammaproteobacteria bacterium]
MKPSLQLKIGQSLTMTPQLQQAIRLLQLSSMELQVEIQEALESNMMLESVED